MQMKATGLNCTYGLIDDNTPCSLPPAMPGVRNLTTLDIKGSQADTKLLRAFTHYKRRADQIRRITQNDDVIGSNCGSLKRGTVTSRMTNPLMPKYQLPGNSEIPTRSEINDPYADQKKPKS